MKKVVLVYILLTLVNAKQIKKKHVSFLSEEKFLENLKTDDGLKNLQRSIILQRNYKCLNREYFQLEDLVEFEKNSQLSTYRNLEFQLEKTCYDFESIKKMTKSINITNNFTVLSGIIINQMFNEGCELCHKEIEIKDKKHELKVWIYSIISTSAITLSSFCGAFLIPFTKHKYYRRILMFLISLAVGTLGGTGFIHLIPQAFGIDEDINYSFKHKYLWKCLVISGGLYFFFIVEQILNFFIQFRKHKKIQKKKRRLNVESKPMLKNHSINDDSKQLNNNFSYEYVYQTESDALSRKLAKSSIGSIPKAIEKADLDKSELEHTIAPVAWIIIVGEGLHNFIDGLSIGAAFTDSIINGLSLSLAIICEEFPHKLGDFAILIAAGMPLRVALFCNFLSSCFIYIGLFLGIFAGENLDANMWIYAVAGGMFIYIAVCDMIPELSEMSKEIEKEIFEKESKNFGSEHGTKEKFAIKIKLINFFIQNFGILTGFSFMTLIAVYADKIKL